MGLHWQLEAGQQTGHEKWTDHQEVTRLVTVQYNNVAHRHGRWTQTADGWVGL